MQNMVLSRLETVGWRRSLVIEWDMYDSFVIVLSLLFGSDREESGEQGPLRRRR